MNFRTTIIITFDVPVEQYGVSFIAEGQAVLHQTKHGDWVIDDDELIDYTDVKMGGNEVKDPREFFDNLKKNAGIDMIAVGVKAIKDYLDNYTADWLINTCCRPNIWHT